MSHPLPKELAANWAFLVFCSYLFFIKIVIHSFSFEGSKIMTSRHPLPY